MHNYNLAKNIKYLRAERRMSQDEFGFYVGLSQQTISRIESGHPKSMGLDKIIKISDFLGVTIDDLVNKDLGQGKISNTPTHLSTENLLRESDYVLIDKLANLTPQNRDVVESMIDTLLIQEGQDRLSKKEFKRLEYERMELTEELARTNRELSEIKESKKLSD